MKGFKISRFWSIVLTFLAVYGLIKWGIPALSRYITTLPFPLPVPGTLMFMYMMLTAVALFLLVTFSDEFLQEFMRPVKKFLSGGYGKLLRLFGLTLAPVLAAWQIYDMTLEHTSAEHRMMGGLSGVSTNAIGG